LRTSWRSCTGEAIPEYSQRLLKDYIHTKSSGPSHHAVRFELVAAGEGDAEELKGLGTYGFIRGASAFIIGAVEKRINNLEDYGYLMEDIILYATSLNLSTCWLGGSFQKDQFSKRINIQSHEIVPAVVSVGIGADQRNLLDRLIRNVARSNKRLPWEHLFFDGEASRPLSRVRADKLALVLDMVRLSPSASNKQPWRLILNSRGVHFFLQRTKAYRKPFFSDLQRIDMGIAMAHFEAVCQELNIMGDWTNGPHLAQPPDNWEYTISWAMQDQ